MVQLWSYLFTIGRGSTIFDPKIEHESFVGIQNGLYYIDKAIELNPKEGQWYYLLGRCLQRIRQVEDISGIPSEREMKALDYAHAITENPLCLIYMAASLREASFHAYNTNGIFESRSFERAKSLYRAAMEGAWNSSNVLARCAFGFWKLPQPYRDPELAKECFQRALEINPQNAMGNHVAALVSESYDKNYNKAKEYYHKASELGAYGAFLNLQKMRLREEEAYDPVPDLECMLTKFAHEPTRLLQTKIHLGAAYLFLRDDLSTALDFWMDVIDKEPSCHMLERYISNIINPKCPLNIYTLIIHETRLALQEDKVVSVGDKLKYQQAYEKCITEQPKFEDLLLSPPESWKKRFHVARKHSNGDKESFSRNNSFNSGGGNSNNWRERGTERGNASAEIGSKENLGTNWKSWSGNRNERNRGSDDLNNGRGRCYSRQNATAKRNIDTNWRLK